MPDDRLQRTRDAYPDLPKWPALHTEAAERLRTHYIEPALAQIAANVLESFVRIIGDAETCAKVEEQYRVAMLLPIRSTQDWWA